MCRKQLAPFLPVPLVKKEGGKYVSDFGDARSIGKVKAFFGNTGILVRAYAYMLAHSAKEFGEIAVASIINANYVAALLKEMYPSYSSEYCMHECVLTPGADMLAKGLKTLDVAKGLLDRGFHAPTIYFPLIVHEAIMIEPTETESKDTLDEFAAAMKSVHDDGMADPQKLKDAPHNMPVKRLDEVQAARQPNLHW